MQAAGTEALKSMEGLHQRVAVLSAEQRTLVAQLEQARAQNEQMFTALQAAESAARWVAREAAAVVAGVRVNPRSPGLLMTGALIN